MNRIQNLLTIVTVCMISISVTSFVISALASVIGTGAIMGLFGYVGIYSGLAMLATGSGLIIISLVETMQEYLHHLDSAATNKVAWQ